MEMVSWKWIDLNGNLYVWDLPTAAATAVLPWPMFAHDAQHTTQHPQSFADTHPPTVTLTAPTADSAVFGTTTVSANATDNMGVAGVQFKLDGVDLGSEDTDSGIIRPVVDRVFPFESTKEALAYVEKGRTKGKVIVKVR